MTKKRISIEDVVRVTGLSRSTVDRVLNSRDGVRTETKTRVENALQSLGYSSSALMSRQSPKAAVITVLYSEGTNPFFADIKKGVKAATEPFEKLGMPVHFQAFDPYRLSTLVHCLRNLPQDTTCVITVGADNIDVEVAINDLDSIGIRVITIVSDVPNSKRYAYIGQDNFTAGRTAGRLMLSALPPEPGEIAMLLGHLQFRHLLDRQSGFQQIVGLERPDLSIVAAKPYGADPKTAAEIVEDLAYKHPGLSGIYIAGGGQPYLIEALADLKNPQRVMIGHEATAINRRFLKEGVLNFVLAHDIYEIGRRAMEIAFMDDSRDNHTCSIAIYVAENLPAD